MQDVIPSWELQYGIILLNELIYLKILFYYRFIWLQKFSK
jgi:hypothetical protein